jgi:hypothetical protein
MMQDLARRIAVGASQRDDHPVPAEASRRLQKLAGPGARIEVTNFGAIGYVFTHESLQLMMELRAGNHPGVVVFYDSINEGISTMRQRTKSVVAVALNSHAYH